jgi:two-component system, sensor histidine kinase and response regulator
MQMRRRALMAITATPDSRHVFLENAPATRRERQIVLAIAAVSFVAFAAAVPFARLPLMQFPAFIPSYEAALFFIDLITAALLFDQFGRLRSIAILILACGYLFDALMIVPHALSFPGAFTRTGLLGATDQTTTWLYVFWHGGFSLFVIAYAMRRRVEQRSPSPPLPQAAWLIAASVAGAAALAIALLATRGSGLLPIVMQAGDYSLLVRKGISPAVWLFTLVAVLALWRSKQRVVDLWLMVVMWIWLFDIALSAIIGSHRFDLGFYAGRIFGLIAASFLLIALLVEMARLHATALGAAASAEARLAQLARRRERADPAMPRGARTDTFIHRQNIAHYRSLLESGSLDEVQRRSIEKLLDEEETKIRSGQTGG